MAGANPSGESILSQKASQGVATPDEKQQADAAVATERADATQKALKVRQLLCGSMHCMLHRHEARCCIALADCWCCTVLFKAVLNCTLLVLDCSKLLHGGVEDS